MRFKTRIMLAVGCGILLALSLPAFSLPTPRGLAADHRAQTGRAVQKKKKDAQHAPKTSNTKRIVRRPAQEHDDRLPAAERAQPVAVSKPMLGWPTLVSEARKYLGTNPTDRKRLWCATFMNLVLAKVGYAGTNSDAAKSFAYYGRRISEPKVGAIAVLSRGKRGGHVGVVTGIDAQGNPIIISGNHGRRVGEGVYPRSRVIAYVMPTEGRPVTTQLAARSTPNRSSSEPGIESPITELLAAIEAEQSRPERPSQPAPQAQARAQAQPQPPQQPQARAQPQPAEPHRAVQQVPEPVSQSTLSARRTLPLDPSLAKMLGIEDRAQDRPQDRTQVAPPQHPAPQRQRQVQQNQPGRVANASTGIAGVFGLR
jgi:uncharacterized protein (TIGR02594 family)